MAQLKTKPTGADVDAFLDAVPDESRRQDARDVDALLRRLTGHAPVIWGDSLVGYGQSHLRYASGREIDFFEVGFSPRKSALVLYVMEHAPNYSDLLARLGRHSTGKGCLYVKRLSDVDLGVLEELVRTSLGRMRGAAG